MNDVSNSIENTAAYMQEISASINDLTGNIEEITKRYDNFNFIVLNILHVILFLYLPSIYSNNSSSSLFSSPSNSSILI